MEGARYATWSAPTDVGARAPEPVGLLQGFWLIGAVSSFVFIALLAIPLGFGVASVLGGVALGAFFAFRVSMISVVSEWFARRQKGSAAAFAMYKSLGIKGAHPVRINVILDSYEIGSDEGLVEFSDGLLKFHGTKTRFAITADLATESAFLSGSTFPKVNGLDHVVQIWPFERLDPNEDRVISHLYVREFEAWAKQGPEPSGEIVLPPKAPATVREVRALREPLSPLHDFALLLLFATYFSKAIDEQGLAILMPASLILLQTIAFLAAYSNRKRFLQKLSL